MEVKYSASILKKGQLAAVSKYGIDRIYIPYDMFYTGQTDIHDIDFLHHDREIDVYLSLPRIIRKRDDEYLKSLASFLMLGKADGLLVKSIDGLGFVQSLKDDLDKQFISINGEREGFTPLYIHADHSLYTWNISALDFNREFTCRQTAATELNIHELKELNDRDITCVIYGRVPLMISAGCVKKTTGNCEPDKVYDFEWKLIDRKNRTSLVYNNCIHCYNEIFNSVPTSLHKYIPELIKAGFYDFRLDFTDESIDRIDQILGYYITEQRSSDLVMPDHTAAHFSKGVL